MHMPHMLFTLQICRASPCYRRAPSFRSGTVVPYVSSDRSRKTELALFDRRRDRLAVSDRRKGRKAAPAFAGGPAPLYTR
eukprot:scaffold31452_cov112-Isochrysis_galbana.AAC.4